MTLLLIKKPSFVLYVGYLQGYILDQDVVTVSKGGRAQIIVRCPSFVGDGDNEDFYKTWMTV
jgi:hypothetical protein